jgi:hypothetical protein
MSRSQAKLVCECRAGSGERGAGNKGIKSKD